MTSKDGLEGVREREACTMEVGIWVGWLGKGLAIKVNELAFKVKELGTQEHGLKLEGKKNIIAGGIKPLE